MIRPFWQPLVNNANTANMNTNTVSDIYKKTFARKPFGYKKKSFSNHLDFVKDMSIYFTSTLTSQLAGCQREGIRTINQVNREAKVLVFLTIYQTTIHRMVQNVSSSFERRRAKIFPIGWFGTSNAGCPCVSV